MDEDTYADKEMAKAQKPMKIKKARKPKEQDRRSITSRENIKKAHEKIHRALEKSNLEFSESDTDADDEAYLTLPLDDEEIPGGPTPRPRVDIIPPPESDDEIDVNEHINALWVKKLEKRNKEIESLNARLKAKTDAENKLKTVLKKQIDYKRQAVLNF